MLKKNKNEHVKKKTQKNNNTKSVNMRRFTATAVLRCSCRFERGQAFWSN